MGNFIDPAAIKGSAYLMVNNGLIEDLGCAFTSLTGYSRTDFYRKRISEVMHKLFGFNLDMEDCTFSENYLFKKSREAIEVRVNVCQAGNENHEIYLFQQKNNFILNSELSFVCKLLKDNYMGVCLYSCPDFRLLKANRKYMEYMNVAYHTEGNPIGRCLNELIPSYYGSRTEEQMLDLFNTGETLYVKEQQTVCRKGECRYWNTSMNPISEDGKVKYIVAMVEDITEETLKRKFIEEKNEELKRAIEMKDEMLLLISHELKTPLSIINSSIQTVELICSNELSDRIRRYLNKIRQNTYRQLKLVNNILDNTRVKAGLFKMNRTSVDIVLLTKVIIDSMIVFAERKGIRISFSSTLSNSIISIDVDIYERILLNLLSNAVKFTPNGKSIEVSVFQVPAEGIQRVCLQVKDYGIGIPNDQKELIFERFRRVEPVSARRPEGTGIGLYLVKMLVSLMDGEIEVESKEGFGSTFSLFLPLIKVNNAASEPIAVKDSDEQLITASAIEFSDIYYGA